MNQDKQLRVLEEVYGNVEDGNAVIVSKSVVYNKGGDSDITITVKALDGYKWTLWMDSVE